MELNIKNAITVVTLGDRMATQGIVSVLENGEVKIKAIAGCDGYRAKELAQRIKEAEDIDIEKVHKLAEEISFGCNRCRFTMNSEEILPREPFSELYREKFEDPEFNPRWDLGTASYIILVELEKNNIKIIEG